MTKHGLFYFELRSRMSIIEEYRTKFLLQLCFHQNRQLHIFQSPIVNALQKCCRPLKPLLCGKQPDSHVITVFNLFSISEECKYELGNSLWDFPTVKICMQKQNKSSSNADINGNVSLVRFYQPSTFLVRSPLVIISWDL